MIKLIPILLLLASPVLSDFTVPATMQGVSTGSLDVSGNIVANVDRIQGILNQFHTIVETLYYLQSPELTFISDKFRYVMDSLVETGSPIFQGLSNVAKISSGDVKKAFSGIRADISNAVGLNTEHLRLVNDTRFYLGETSTVYFDSVLNQLASNLGNITRLLNNIQEAVIEIQKMNPKTQESIKARLPNEDIKALNAVLRQYILIGDAAVPEVRSVANGFRMVDNFSIRVQSQFNSMRQNLASSESRLPAILDANWYNKIRTSLSNTQKQMVSVSNTAQLALTKLLVDDSDDLRSAANQTLPVLQAFVANISRMVDVLSSPDNLQVDLDTSPEQIFNYTESLTNEVSFGLAFALIQRLSAASTCYYRYNPEFDKIPRLLNNMLQVCSNDRSNYLFDVAQTLNYVALLASYDFNYGILAVQRCTGLITTTATELTKYQVTACLDDARSFLDGGLVYEKQMSNYWRILQEGLQQSTHRYNFCTRSTQDQALALLVQLDIMIERCLNPTPTIIPYSYDTKPQITNENNANNNTNNHNNNNNNSINGWLIST